MLHWIHRSHFLETRIRRLTVKITVSQMFINGSSAQNSDTSATLSAILASLRLHLHSVYTKRMNFIHSYITVTLVLCNLLCYRIQLSIQVWWRTTQQVARAVYFSNLVTWERWEIGALLKRLSSVDSDQEIYILCSSERVQVEFWKGTGQQGRGPGWRKSGNGLWHQQLSDNQG